MELALAEIPGANRQTGKTSNGTLSTIRTQTTACKEGKYCSQDSGPEKLTKYTNQMHRDLQKDNILNDVICHNTVLLGQLGNFKFNKKSGTTYIYI